MRRSGFLSLLFCMLATAAPAQDGVGSAHLPIDNPSELPPAQLEQIYNELKQRMAEGYALSKLEIIDDYQSWRRYNTAPYLSATHGLRFINNYANEKGRGYGTLSVGQSLPAGTVLAKDAMTLTADGKNFPGALFIMEKLPAGANSETADWRYLVVNPDGSLFGDTKGDEPELVDYCHACHESKADQDYVFLIPEEFRVKP